MKGIISQIFTLALVMASIGVKAQSTIDPGFPSGDYDAVKVSCDVNSQSFTIVDDSEQGKFSCKLFLIGKLIKNKDGKYPVKAYPYGFDNQFFDGVALFRKGKNGHKGTLIIQVSESGSCQNMTDYKSGLYLPLDQIVPYHTFSIIKTKKAFVYAEESLNAHQKGYFLEGDFVSVIKQSKDFCYVESLNKPSFKAWISKSDLVL